MRRGDDSVLSIGIDESNHGRSPEIFVAVFSPFNQDIRSEELEKSRHDHHNLLIKLRKRNYSFLLVDESTFRKKTKYGAKRNMDLIVANLLYGESFEDYNRLRILIDGEHTTRSLNDIASAVYSTTGFRRSKVEIASGPNFDSIFPVVNMADEMAHFIFRHYSPERISQDPHRKYLRNVA